MESNGRLDEEIISEIKGAWNKKCIDYSDENGNCNGCSECCNVFVPITKKELKLLKRLLTKKVLKRYKKSKDDYSINCKCPFSTDKGCSIYNLRPSICKQYHCKKELSKRDISEFKSSEDLPIKMLYQILEDKETVELMEAIHKLAVRD